MAISEADILKGLNLGTTKPTVQETTEDALRLVVTAWVDASIQEAKDILKEQGRNASSSTANSLRPVITVGESAVLVQIFANPSAEFLDKGVKGIGGVGNLVTEGKYSFKNLKTPPAMIESIKNWIPFKGIGLPEGFKDFKQLSYAIAKNVKKRGVKPSGFLSDAFGSDSVDALASSVGTVLRKNMKGAIARQITKK